MNLAFSQIAFSLEEQDRALEILAEKGITGLEIAPTMVVGASPYDAPEKAEEFARTTKEKYGLSVCSMQSIWYGVQGSIFGKEREFLLEYTKKALDFAHRCNAKNLVFGCPKNRNIPPGKTGEQAVAFFKEVAKKAAGLSLCFALEANPPVYGTNFMNTTKEAFQIAALVGSPGCTVNLDIGAMIINGEQPSEVLQDVSLVSHVHLSEPGLAMIQKREIHREVAGILKNTGYQGYVSVEMKQQSLAQIEQAADYLVEVFG